MNIHLTPEQQKIVQDELQAGHFGSIEEIIGEALKGLREKKKFSSPDSGYCEAVGELLAFVEKNCVRLEGVSVKDLIHEGHRL